MTDPPKSKQLTAADFTQRFGFAPEQDDLQRANCTESGKVGHYMCGVCPKHDKPRFVCGCVVEAAPVH